MKIHCTLVIIHHTCNAVWGLTPCPNFIADLFPIGSPFCLPAVACDLESSDPEPSFPAKTMLGDNPEPSTSPTICMEPAATSHTGTDPQSWNVKHETCETVKDFSFYNALTLRLTDTPLPTRGHTEYSRTGCRHDIWNDVSDCLKWAAQRQQNASRWKYPGLALKTLILLGQCAAAPQFGRPTQFNFVWVIVIVVVVPVVVVVVVVIVIVIHVV